MPLLLKPAAYALPARVGVIRHQPIALQNGAKARERYVNTTPHTLFINEEIAQLTQQTQKAQ